MPPPTGTYIRVKGNRIVGDDERGHVVRVLGYDSNSSSFKLRFRPKLTPKQKYICKRISQGYGYRETARLLGISLRAIQDRLAGVKKKSTIRRD